MEGVSAMNYFSYTESPYNNKKYTIILDSMHLPFTYPINSSFQVFAARVLGLEWAEFLYYCRDAYDAEICGKNSMYPVPYFSLEKIKELVTDLNHRLNDILKSRSDIK